MASQKILPKWKQSEIGHIYRLDEDVTEKEFTKNTNFSGALYFDKDTKLVKYYCETEYCNELNEYCSTNDKLMLLLFDYIDDDCIYVLSEFITSTKGWNIKLKFSSLNHSGVIILRVDTGATFTMLRVNQLANILKINEDSLKETLQKEAKSIATAQTATGTIDYYAIHLVTEMFGEEVPIRVYVDVSNTLPTALFGFDMIQALHFISVPGQDPMLLSFSQEIHKQFEDTHPETQCNIIDLYSIF